MWGRRKALAKLPEGWRIKVAKGSDGYWRWRVVDPQGSRISESLWGATTLTRRGAIADALEAIKVFTHVTVWEEA